MDICGLPADVNMCWGGGWRGGRGEVGSSFGWFITEALAVLTFYRLGQNWYGYNNDVHKNTHHNYDTKTFIIVT